MLQPVGLYPGKYSVAGQAEGDCSLTEFRWIGFSRGIHNFARRTIVLYQTDGITRRCLKTNRGLLHLFHKHHKRKHYCIYFINTTRTKLNAIGAINNSQTFALTSKNN